ncbi:MAG: NADP-dependent oxidoreductase [Tabrizicola sp.]|uniref:NADP-dependent oxidoreductase n=1 Tax=Tabrizicola sp. TaxID=2005166 RepID=UPI0027366D65|nr:NADP-dependent oxidoreductase [Tabrizicola sp.]MDP3261838.1 NADP-dependent oxidoreductase [Tabrizicola sp.]MDP3649554.1 NADP-dependent oxidoreductase [Paracoccaceae bacterium]MDZ4069510.1 NADP-dependent oxidoreductase [Tabrizicola sp.]
MKAARIHAYGASSEIRIEDAPLPMLNDDDVLIRVVATSVNPVDWKIRKGYLKAFIPYEMPLIMGWDVSGVVEKTGPAVTRFKPGDAVYSRPDIARNGAYAEYVAVRETEIAFKPATISHVEAASLPLVSITAWEALFTTANLTPGQRVLIHAGAGGVGSIAVQLARAKGAHVTTTASAPKSALVRSLGADEVIDYHAQDFANVAKDMDVVFDTIGGEVQEKSWGVLKPGGMLVSITDRPSEDRAKAMGKRAGYVFIGPNAAILKDLGQMVDLGQIRPLIAAEFGLNDTAKAQDFSETGRATGKIVIYAGHP